MIYTLTMHPTCDGIVQAPVMTDETTHPELTLRAFEDFLFNQAVDEPGEWTLTLAVRP